MDVYILLEATRPGNCSFIVSNEEPRLRYRGTFWSLQDAKTWATERFKEPLSWWSGEGSKETHGHCNMQTLHFVIYKDEVK